MRTPESSPPRTAPTSKRLDVQGVRALAVLLVIGNHIHGVPTGGYVGVDVFFVVSGYVITRLLLRELDSTNSISLRGFYLRRVKRIAPASLLVLGATCVVGAVLFTSPLERSLLDDCIWAFLLVANWHFIAIGTDYLHATDLPSAIQHYWSLAVEEQFYLIWPALLLALWWATKRRGAVARALPIAVFILLSFAWSAWEVSAHPATAYFSTLSRAWELAAGALLAVADPLWRRLPVRFRGPLGWCGLGVVLLTSVTFTAATPFPGPMAALPVLGTAAILVAGEGGSSRLVPLTNPVAGYIGDISYSLYLWHFPILTFVALLHPQLGKSYVAWSLVLTFGLAVLTHHLVEEPFRHLRLRRPAAQRRGAPPRWRRGALACLAIATVLLMTTAFVTRSPLRAAASAPLTSLDTPFAKAQEDTPAFRARSAAIDAALASTSWPRFQVPVAQLDDHLAPQWTHDGCLTYAKGSLAPPMPKALSCVYGDRTSSKVLAVLGDSTATSYLPGIIPALGRTWRIEVYAMAMCPAVYLRVRLGTGEPHPFCQKFQADVAAHLRASHPTEIVLTSSPETVERLLSRTRTAHVEPEWQRAADETIRTLAPDTGRIVFLDPPPATARIQDCDTAISHPADCVVGVEGDAVIENDAQYRASAHHSDVSIVPTVRWFCSAQGLCPAFVGSNAETVDARHLVDRQTITLAPLLRDALDPATP